MIVDRRGVKVNIPHISKLAWGGGGGGGGGGGFTTLFYTTLFPFFVNGVVKSVVKKVH